MVLLELEPYGHTAEYSVPGIGAAAVDYRGICHDLSAAPHIGGLNYTAFPEHSISGGNRVIGVDETGMEKIKGDPASLNIFLC